MTLSRDPDVRPARARRAPPNVLTDILLGVREDLAARQALTSAAELEAHLPHARPVQDPRPALRSPGASVVAEIKRHSPSRGHLAEIADPPTLALRYQAGGAAAISVLTEGRRFSGSMSDLRSVCASVEIPVLRKDFIVDSYQLLEARAAGADLVLLIVAALGPSQLSELLAQANDLGLTPLVEVHDEAEVERAVDLGAELIGVNTRDLRDLTVKPALFSQLAPSIPSELITIAESGISSPNEVTEHMHAGANAVLVGEALVTNSNPESLIRAMTGLAHGN